MEYGTPNILGAAGLHAGVSWILEKGIETIHGQEMALASQSREGLEQIDGVRLHCQDSLTDHLSVMRFNVDGLEAGETGTMLDVDHGIACRTGLHCAPLVHEQLGTAKIKGSVRFGIGPLNTEDHIKRAVRGVAEIAALVNARRKPRVPMTKVCEHARSVVSQ